MQSIEEIDPFHIPIWAQYLENCIYDKNIPLFYKKFTSWFNLTQRIIARDLEAHIHAIQGDIMGQKQREIWKRCREAQMANEAKKTALEQEKEAVNRVRLKNSNEPLWRQRL